MHYTLNRETLATALRCVEPALSTMDYTGSRDFLIELSGKAVLLAGSNGNMAVQAKFSPIVGEGDFRPSGNSNSTAEAILAGN